MNADRLLDLYENVADASDAVPRLRRFVLDLAVRGKLVPQDAGDEPASELLKRIAAEKARLVKAGEIKRPKPVDPMAIGEMSFPPPPGWTWARLADVAVCLDYMRKPINGTERDRRIEGKSENELFPYFGATQQQGWIDDYIFDEELVLLGEDGVPFFDPYRSKAYIISGKTWVNNHAHVFKGILISHSFLAHYLNVFDYTGRVVGATRSKLNQARAVDIPIPLPPLAEQRRIVAKVEELMALLDRLEAARTAREATRDRLTAASLARLTAPDTQASSGKVGTGFPSDDATNKEPAEDFPTHARFALSTLPALTTRPDQIKPLRQTILNLAVRGKLVEQDPTDEPIPAGLLLKKPDRKQPTGRTGASLGPVESSEVGFDLAEQWVWGRLFQICEEGAPIVYGILQPGPDIRPKGIPYIRPTEIKDGRIDLHSIRHTTVEIAEKYSRASVQAGDLLMTIVGTIGAVAEVPAELDGGNITQSSCRLRTRPNLVNSDFLKIALRSDCALNQIGRMRLGAAVKRLNIAHVRAIAVPLPPLAEQHRIVAKVDALMALCDRLEAALTTADTTRARLLEALLHEALDPATNAITEAAE